ncbi:MAG: RNA polymerase sigma factor [Steroidobacteraceae bacterium]
MGSFIGIQVDGEVLQRIAAADPAATRALYGQLAGPCFALIRRLVRDWAAAEDIFQDAMLAVLQQAGSFRGEAPFGIWVRQIVLRHCLMYLRSPWQRARRALFEVSEGSFEPVSAEPGLADALDLERALAQLAPTARAVLWLHDAEGLTHEQIAAGFGRSTSFSKSQLSRAHAALRLLLAPVEEDSACRALNPVAASSA